ncbi:MAG: N-acetyl-gamma-glutamyl-phosphate reductase [Deltaproteobacteria bacterium SG8_13]|nr:MAG: N-acetyl-gamma-glutamyl-phosphate reductase [Deltaproteobacteria bacterium SG8_13]
MTRVAVVGATGYAGAELVRILSGHPSVELTALTSRQHIGERFDAIFPALAGRVELICEKYNAGTLGDQADVVFTALPHQLPMEIVPELLKRGKKVVDLSADFRFKDPDRYARHYQPHTAGDLLQQAVYGLSEVYLDEIRGASLVGNPGCYPTSVLLPLIPLVKADLLDPATIVVDAKSGVSGAGRSPSLTTLFSEVSESFKPYKVAVHRHNPEMEEVLSAEAGTGIRITFVPHLVPMSRGMQTTIYAGFRKAARREDIHHCLQSFYDGRAFIRMRKDGLPPDSLHVRGTNYCDIGVEVDTRNNRLILMSAIDNLVKGAAGQAVQNMNIMLGLDETTGLMQMPYPL